MVFVLAGTYRLSAQDKTYESLKSGFENPPVNARPKVYWWCLNGNIDTVRAKEEFAAMKKAGISGFDLFEIGVPKADTIIPGGPAFLSDESLKVIKSVIREAGKLNLTVGLNLASSWNAGGSWIKPEHGGKSLYFSKINIKGNSSLQKTKIPFPEVKFPKASLVGGTGKPMIPYRDNGKPAYYEEVAVLALPAGISKNSLDTTRIINVSRYFDPAQEVLNWNVPAGDWEICRYICSNSGQQLVLPSPSSAGLTIDHFDSVAVETHLMYIINRLKPVVGDFRNTALKSFYLASYEARGFVWTSTLPAEFRKVNGYDIYKFLPSFFNPELFSKETTKKTESDFKRTLSELMINNLYKKAKEICNNYGLKINCEAGGPGYPLYNGPAEPLKALGALDLPRGEFWVNHSRYYKDADSKDSIDILRVVKEVAAASHIYQRGIVEEESFSSFQHWQEGPFDLKTFGDRAFCEGMNRVVFHGFSHNPAGSGFPGIVYHAGTHFNNKRVWWSKVKPFVDYISRASFVFQEADFFSDVLYYYGDKIPNAATAKNTRFVVSPGYDYEVINTEILLNNLTVKNGKLLLSNGAVFSILALENEDRMNPAVQSRLAELTKQGAVIVNARPKKVPGSNNKSSSDNESADMLKVLDVPPDFDYSDKESYLLDFIHYRKGEMDFYFIRNTSGEWVSRECRFRQNAKIPEIWDPLTGNVIPVPVFNQAGKSIKIPVTLAPYGSYFVVFRKDVENKHYTSVSGSDINPPLMEFTKQGIMFLNDGNYLLKNNSTAEKVENKQQVYLLKGEWNVTFSKDWGAPDSALFPELASWSVNKNEGIRYYSGIGTYHKSFKYEINSAMSEAQRMFLDLGNLSKVAEVWLNGRSLGIVWAKPFRYDITGIIKNGINVITVEVANTWSNRITGDALTGEKYTKTNITFTDIPGTYKKNVPWAKVPLIESGLFGPVVIKTVTLVQ